MKRLINNVFIQSQVKNSFYSHDDRKIREAYFDAKSLIISNEIKT